MSDLPVEIWHHILDYISSAEIDRLWSLNRVFFYRAMFIRWHSITLPITQFREEVLERIQDPFVNRHVRKLHLVIHFDVSGSSSSGAPGIRSILSTGLSRKLIKSLARRPPSHKVVSPIDVLNIVAGTKFPDTEEFRITTSTATWPQSAYQSLQTILPSLSRNVDGGAFRTLSLHATLPELQTFLHQKPTFPSLVRFELEIKQPESVSQPRDEAVVTQYLIPFINTAQRHLQQLSVKCYYPLDLSSFFDNLAVFPSLLVLNIFSAFNKTDIYPNDFTQTCSTKFPALVGLHLPVIPRQRFGHADIDRHHILYSWLKECIRTEGCFSGLRYLEIYPTTLPGALDLVLIAIRSNASTLRQMQIRGRFFNPAEIAQVLDALAQCPNLKDLRLNVKLLDITTFAQLTSTLVTLERLIIAIETASPTFDLDLQSYRCPASKLKHITTKPLPDMRNVFSLNELCQSLPSIRTIGVLQILVVDDI